MSQDQKIDNWVAHRLKNPVPLEEHLENWEKANKIYYGPERDHVNYPILTQPEGTPPVRFKFIPESWFTFFYEKTGVSGPYTLGVGLIATLISKEFWIIEHQFVDFLAFWIMCGILIKKGGPAMGKWLDDTHSEYRAKHWQEPIAKLTAGASGAVKSGELAIWQTEGSKHIFEGKRENVDLQLEATYRQRLVEVHHEVKKRLDYQMSVENTGRRFEQTHMVNWIVDNVTKGITPQQEKESIAKCIADLKGLAVKHA